MIDSYQQAIALQDTVGDRLTQAMKRAGLKNPDVARAAGVHDTTVSRWRHDAQVPEERELSLVVALLRQHGVDVTSSWLRDGSSNGQRVSEPSRTRSMVYGSPEELEFGSATAAQRGRVWLEQFLLEIAEEGATQEFIDSSRRLLMNPANYEHGFGAAAGHPDEMSDDQKLRHMQALAVGIRAALKDRLKKGRK